MAHVPCESKYIIGIPVQIIFFFKIMILTRNITFIALKLSNLENFLQDKTSFLSKKFSLTSISTIKRNPKNTQRIIKNPKK